MADAKFNELVKLMLNFKKEETIANLNEEVKTEVKEEVNEEQVKQPILEKKTNVLPRKDRRAQERISKRLEKINKMRTDKQKMEKDEKLKKLDEVKEELRKSNFSDEDRKRLEKIIYNK